MMFWTPEVIHYKLVITSTKEGYKIWNNLACTFITPLLYLDYCLLWITYLLFIVIDTCFVLWLFSCSNNLFFFIVIDTCEEKLALWHVVKYDSIEWLFTDCFCLIIWYSTGSCLSCYCFCKEEIGVYKLLFFQTLHSIF